MRNETRCSGGPPPLADGDVIRIDVGYGKVAIIDAADRGIANSKRWRVYDGGQYAYAYEGKRKIYLHRMIANAPDGFEVDHLDGDTFNDRRGNLRVVTRQQNAENRKEAIGASGLRGVRSTRNGKFVARVKVHGRERFLGTFDSLEMAGAVAGEARRQMMTNAAENRVVVDESAPDDLSVYLAQNCVMCERRSPTGLHLTCVVLSHLSAAESTTGWVSHEDLRDAVGRSDSLHIDMERIRSAVKGLRFRGWTILNGRFGYRLVRE